MVKKSGLAELLRLYTKSSSKCGPGVSEGTGTPEDGSAGLLQLLQHTGLGRVSYTDIYCLILLEGGILGSRLVPSDPSLLGLPVVIFCPLYSLCPVLFYKDIYHTVVEPTL